MRWITKLEQESPDGSVVWKYRVGAYKNGRRRFKTFTNEKDTSPAALLPIVTIFAESAGAAQLSA